MTTTQFFKKYPGAQEVLKVGEQLFFAQFEAAARKAALRAGLPLERISRPVKENKAAAKPEVVEPEAPPSQPE